MANAEYLQGPNQETVVPPAGVEDPNAAARAMAWDESATFDKPSMPKSEADRLTWLQNSEIDQRAWDALIADSALFKVVYDLASR